MMPRFPGLSAPGRPPLMSTGAPGPLVVVHDMNIPAIEFYYTVFLQL